MKGRAGLLVRHSLLDFSIGGFPGCSFIINIGLQLFIRIFQIGNRIFALTGFFFNGIGIGFNLGIESGNVSPHTIGLDYVVSGLCCIIVNSFRFYFPCY